jgi:hypothetical protein
MPQAALSSQCTINDAARPELLKSPGISGHPNANWTDPRMKCPGTVFAAYHNGCMLEPWQDLCCGNRIHNTLARPWRHRRIRL